MITRQKFEPIGFRKTVRAKTKSGKWRQRTEHFWQTQSPWNQKTHDQIISEERKKAEAWEKKAKAEIEAME